MFSRVLGHEDCVLPEELGDAVPQKPVIFNKPASVALRASGEKVLDVAGVLPYNRGTIHYEAEIVIRMGVRRKRTCLRSRQPLSLLVSEDVSQKPITYATTVSNLYR